jgi:hypothetical protein
LRLKTTSKVVSFLSHEEVRFSGNNWTVTSEIFWKAHGDHLEFAEAIIACVFKKLCETTARWYDAGEQVERHG